MQSTRRLLVHEPERTSSDVCIPSVTPCNLMPEYFPGRKAILENPVWGLNRGRGALDAQAPVPSVNQKKLTEHEIGDRLSIVNPKTKECAAP